jgi:hypothetical protein
MKPNSLKDEIEKVLQLKKGQKHSVNRPNT